MKEHSAENIVSHMPGKRNKTNYLQNSVDLQRIRTPSRWSTTDFIVVIWLTCIIDAAIVSADGNPKSSQCGCTGCENIAERIKSWMDETEKPCNNFFQFACGGWMKRQNIPPEKKWATVWDTLRKNLELKLKCVLESKKNPSTHSKDERTKELIAKTKKYFRNCMNYDSESPRRVLRDIFSIVPLPYINEPEWANAELERILVDLETVDVPILMKLTIRMLDLLIEQPPYQKNARHYTSSAFKARRGVRAQLIDCTLHKAYKDLNVENVTVDGEALVHLEGQIAKATIPRWKLKKESRWTVSKLKSSMTNFNWSTYLDILMDYQDDKREFTDSYIFRVQAPQYLKNLDTILEGDGVKDKLGQLATFLLLERFRDHLPMDYQEVFADYDEFIKRKRQQYPRWRICVDIIKFNRFPDVLSHLYADEYFDIEAKREASEMIYYIKAAFRNFLKNNKWIDAAGRLRLDEKILNMCQQVGSPEYIYDWSYLKREYDSVAVSDGDFMMDEIKNSKRIYSRRLKSVRQPIAWNRWLKTASSVDAYYKAAENELYITMGRFASPFFGKKYPKYLNYGGMGSVIGHEIAHALDEAERDRDKHEKNVLSRKAAKAYYKKAAQCFTQQYSSYTAPTDETLKINGAKTLYENVAENGGIQRTFEGYKEYVQRYGQEKKLPGLRYTPEQLFFINYGQAFCSKMNEKGWRFRIRYFFSTPSMYRIIGALSNSQHFHKAFNCRPGDKMNPKKKCSLW